MGSKAIPSKHDCYHRARRNEPLFILRGQDPFAANRVRSWAAVRWLHIAADEKYDEAIAIADEMDRYASTHAVYKHSLASRDLSYCAPGECRGEKALVWNTREITKHGPQTTTLYCGSCRSLHPRSVLELIVNHNGDPSFVPSNVAIGVHVPGVSGLTCDIELRHLRELRDTDFTFFAAVVQFYGGVRLVRVAGDILVSINHL